MNTDKPCRWVNNENIPAAHQLEVLDAAIAMIGTVKDLLQSIHAGGNEFSSGVINALDTILDKHGKFNFYSSLRNWRLGLEAQADKEAEAEEAPTYECPECHEFDDDDTSIKDHGHCHECHVKWQNGELDWQIEDREEMGQCPLCGSDRVMPGLSTKAHTMAFCGNCGHTWEVDDGR